MNKIDEALNWFKNYALPALSNTPHDIGHALVIKNTLTAAKEREAVDVEQLKQSYPHEMAMVEGSAGQYDIDMISSYNQAIDDMHERGLLTSSEKPTHSIPDVELKDGIGKLDHFWRWIERAYFDKSLTLESCVKILVHSPYAPWEFNREKWDTSHKEYDAEIDAVIAKSKTHTLVPNEPTQEMLIYAGTMQGYDTDDMDSSDEDNHIAWWKTMCEAAKGEGE